VDTGGSSDGSDGNTVGANQTPRKKSWIKIRIGESFPALGRSAIYLKESRINALPRLAFSFGYDIS
ncbi:hypothetical protein HN51_035396, partial [Arachis hypogaea]